MPDMNYELAKELKEAGYPQEIYYLEGHISDPNKKPEDKDWHSCFVYAPQLSELVEACGKNIAGVCKLGGNWYAGEKHDYDWFDGHIGSGTTPEIAVAKLWLALKKK